MECGRDRSKSHCMCPLPEGQEQVQVAQDGEGGEEDMPEEVNGRGIARGEESAEEEGADGAGGWTKQREVGRGGLEMAEALCPIKKKIEGWVALLLHKLDRQNDLLEGLMRLKEEDTWLNHEGKEAEAKAANLEEERAGAPAWLEMEDKDEGELEKLEKGSDDQE